MIWCLFGQSWQPAEEHKFHLNIWRTKRRKKHQYIFTSSVLSLKMLFRLALRANGLPWPSVTFAPLLLPLRDSFDLEISNTCLKCLRSVNHLLHLLHKVYFRRKIAKVPSETKCAHEKKNASGIHSTYWSFSALADRQFIFEV